MTAKVSVFIATSLDGFIARKDGDIDWLNDANATVPEGEDCGYRAFMDSVDVLVMGRKTYEQVLSFETWPYGKTPVIVLSRHPIKFPAELSRSVSHSSESPRDVYDRLSREGSQHLYVDGGITIQRFLAAGLINEITITVIPILLGEGLPLFGPLKTDTMLTHLGTKAFDFGFVQMKYSVESETGMSDSPDGTLRKYEPNDVDDILSAWAAASAVAHPFLSEEFIASERRNIPEIYLPNAETWVWEVGGRVVGFIALIDNEVGAVFVDPKFHRHGIGHALMDHARQLRDELEVEVFTANTIGRAFYAKYGFKLLHEYVHEASGCDTMRLRLAR